MLTYWRLVFEIFHFCVFLVLVTNSLMHMTIYSHALQVTASLSGSMSPDVVSSSHGPGTLPGPFQNGPHDPLYNAFNDPEVRVPSQSPEVAYVNELPFRSDPLELRQNENRSVDSCVTLSIYLKLLPDMSGKCLVT